MQPAESVFSPDYELKPEPDDDDDLQVEEHGLRLQLVLVLLDRREHAQPEAQEHKHETETRKGKKRWPCSRVSEQRMAVRHWQITFQIKCVDFYVNITLVLSLILNGRVEYLNIRRSLFLFSELNGIDWLYI